MTSNPDNRYLLAIESASSICSVALFSGSDFIEDSSAVSAQRHNEKLAVMVDELLSKNSVRYENIANIAVSIGPGSFTGLRVGLSFAKGIALGVGCEIIPVNTLEALALTIYRQYSSSASNNSNSKSVFAATVARKTESFGGFYRFNSVDDYPVERSEISLLSADGLLSLRLGNCVIGGEGVDNLISRMEGKNTFSQILISDVKASAIAVGDLALRDISNDNNSC